RRPGLVREDADERGARLEPRGAERRRREPRGGRRGREPRGDGGGRGVHERGAARGSGGAGGGGVAAGVTDPGGEWSLEDVDEAHAANPDTFFVPSLEERRSLAPGRIVRLHFLVLREGPDLPRAERMWGRDLRALERREPVLRHPDEPARPHPHAR